MTAIVDLLDFLPARPDDACYEGFVKLKLAHAGGFSVLLPDCLMADIGGWAWFQPQYFGGCQLGFFDDGAIGQLCIDIVSGVKLFVAFTKSHLVRRCTDGAFLYRCRISGPAGLARMATGLCRPETSGSFSLRLFHHTAPATIGRIRKCSHFLGSRWNLQGNKQLENVHYVYFTNLPRIRSKKDLELIAMASSGELYLLPTNGARPQDVVAINVYRESTRNRGSTLAMWVPSELIAPQHVWRHDPIGAPAYYEVSHPAIFRVGLQPGTVLPFVADELVTTDIVLKRFEYVVLGDADDPIGLVAPYDEEETLAILKIESCPDGDDLFDYWRTHANSDRFSRHRVERQRFVR